MRVFDACSVPLPGAVKEFDGRSLTQAQDLHGMVAGRCFENDGGVGAQGARVVETVHVWEWWNETRSKCSRRSGLMRGRLITWAIVHSQAMLALEASDAEQFAC